MEPTLFQKLKDIFNTIEGWAVALSLLWLGLAKSLGWPVSFDTGAGVISPAALLTIAAPVVLAKLGWQRPFQPAKADAVSAKVDDADKSLANRTVSMFIPVMLGIAGAMLLLPAPSSAQSPRLNYPVADIHRATFGISAGVRAVDDTAAAALGSVEHPLRYDFEPGLQFSYSANKAIAFGLGVTYGTGSKIGATSEGVSYLLGGDGTGAGSQLLMRVRAVQYFGEGCDRLVPGPEGPVPVIAQRQSFDVGLPASLRLLRSSSGKTALYAVIIPSVDLRNARRNSIYGCLQAGWQPQPAQ